MATSLPSLTRRVDDFFTNTWFEIRAEAIDNILDATNVWAALKGAGTFVRQVGGEYITRTIRYGESTRKAVKKGSTFEQGEPELKTWAKWNWKYTSAHVQRDAFDDQKNAGKFQIASLVADRLGAARDALTQGYETDLFRHTDETEAAHDYIQGLGDVVPIYAHIKTTDGTYGGITRPSAFTAEANGVYVATSTEQNPWWAPKYKALTTPKEVNLLSDMKKLYNSCANNQSPPNLIIADQTLFELYEDFAVDASQIIKDESTMLADLGFDVFRFKGKPMIWSPNAYNSTDSENMMYFLNMNFIEMVYDPNMWFDMTEWKNIPLQGVRIAHILSANNLITTQPRRHGLLTDATIS